MNFEKMRSRIFGLEDRLVEDELYRIVWEEIESNKIDPAARARSIEEGAGDEGKTRAAYIKHRVRRLKTEFEIHQRELNEKNERAKEAVDKKSAEKHPKTCSLCGTKLGLFNARGSLCASCSKKILKTKRFVHF
ncbi:hypothetical protein [Roseovarius gaetbuli]|uniref:hypothetical protein n=1 Tax=Roseovarius gaetbuli TaxID=1356575 RepID=UPI00111C5D3B|nr:hypothetical protein [Roseovarius gaetbuli]